MRGERALITGGAGVVGSTLADQLVRAGAAEIVVLDNLVRGRRENLAWAMANGHVRVVEGDIRDRALVAEVTRGIDVVFHQAAIRITQCAEEPRLALEVLVDGTFNVLEAAAQEGVRKVVAASSASIYGLAQEFPTDEQHHPYANDTLYGAAKTFNEGLLRSLHAMNGLDYVALRYFNVYGPRMDIYGVYTEVLVRWMERISAGVPPLILGDGSQTMDFIYIDDVARANVLAASADVTDVAFNVASGVETSLAELAQMLLNVMDADLPVEHGPERGVNKVPRRLADTSLAREQLGFEAEVEHRRGPAPACRVVASRAGGIARGGPGRGAVMEVPFARPAMMGGEAAAMAEVIESGWVSQGTAGRRVRGRVCGARRRARRGCDDELHDGARPRPVRLGRRAGRRGDRSVAVVHRDRQRRVALRRRAGLCGHRSAHLQPRPGLRRARDHAPYEGDHAGAPGRTACGHGSLPRARRRNTRSR